MKKRSRRQPSSNLLPVILIGLGAVLVIGVLVWQAIRSAQDPAGAPSQAGNIPEPGIERVSLANSKMAFDQQNAVFLDVRDAQSYATGHIPGAVNIPYNELESRASELDPNQWIITYCT